MQRYDEKLLGKPVHGSDEGSGLSDETRSLLLEVIEPTLYISSKEEFLDWMQTELQRIFPHQGAMCGIGSVGEQGVRVQQLLGHHVPDEYLHALQRKDGQISSPVLRRWIRERQPVLFDPESWVAEDRGETRWLENLQRFGLNNMAAHGQSEIDGRNGSYFSFSGIPGQLTSYHASLLKLLVPHLHITLIRIFSPQQESPMAGEALQSSLTVREKEVLQWVSAGKTNMEIAQLLEISVATVKNHVHHILGRLQVRTRTQAVAKAIDLKLIASRLVLLLCANAVLLLQTMELLAGDCGCMT